MISNLNIQIIIHRTSRWRCSVKKVFLKKSQNSQENTCASLFFNKIAGLKGCNFNKKETQAQVFSCEFCKIFKNTYFKEHLRTAASKFTTFSN